MNAPASETKTVARRRADPADPSFELDYSPFYWLSRVSGRYVLAMGATLRRVRMDVPRWRVLMILHEHDPASVSMIAELAVIKLSTMTRIVQRMQVEGLVSCSPRPSDARVTEVRLTPSGSAAMEQVRGQASLIFRHAFHDISDKEMLAFIDVLQRLFENLESPPA
ncbi:MAG TPA: MarR family winged helix-turn-helix transcriptional regulator [Caulobacteraceae bacterium]|nr:MarR family winged helix-turn-helix transcriptional regulator [Caulobacteraceae bacterium]